MILNERELENLPLRARQDTVSLRNAFAKLGFNNSDYFQIFPPDGVNIVNYVGKDRRFHFRIYRPRYSESEKKTHFHFSYAPFKDSSLEIKTGMLPIDSLVNIFDRWINLLKEFEQVNAELEDSFLNQFKNEFFAEYMPAQDEEDYVKTFRDEILNVLSETLKAVQLLLEQEAKKEKEDVIAKVIELRNNLQISSRASIRKAIIDLLALTKRYGFKAAFSYLIDKLLGTGVDILIDNAKKLLQ
jgi:hypothetical protein